MNYYNEHDPKAAAWLRELMRAALIPAGDVDERSITDVRATDLVGYAQHHFFAGIGGWPLAFRLAGWPDDRPVGSGSCPCQPFSGAGLQRGEADERHLWPDLCRLIRDFGFATFFGEQVASALGRVWLAGVRTDLEALGYAVGAADLCAAGIGAPHIRQRLYWVADAIGGGCNPRSRAGRPAFAEPQGGDGIAQQRGGTGGLEYPSGNGRESWRSEPSRGAVSGCGAGGMGDMLQPGLEGHAGNGHDRHEPGRLDSIAAGPTAPRGGAWDQFDLLPCLDGKARRVEPGTFPLAHGVPARVGRLRGYGNAILPHLAVEFIAAWLETNLDNNQL